MTENQEQIERLQTRLDRLVKTQIDFQKEVSFIHSELDRLRSVKADIAFSTKRVENPAEPPQKPPLEEPSKYVPPSFTRPAERARSSGYAERKTSEFSAKLDSIADSARANLEKLALVYLPRRNQL